jgi:uracil-DNA glycosylase family 4
MNDRRRRAWAALGIGPAWRLREPARPTAGGEAAGAPPESVAPAASVVPVACMAPAASDALDASDAPGANNADPVGLAQSAAAPSAQRVPVIAAMPWAALEAAVAGCAACGLCRSRRTPVFGTGPRPARWMLVGEAPGEQEDERGEPFVGPAGRLLDQMLAAIGVDRPNEAFVANVLKCRPPGNRNPLQEEVERCEPYLLRQVELLRPTLIVALGRFAAQSLLRTDASIASLRGRVHRLRAGELEVPLVVTYHPAYLLRSLPDKAKSWADLRLARRTVDAVG